ncbi:DUF4381 domain-containing protein [Colwelliaceae bacterium 6441]
MDPLAQLKAIQLPEQVHNYPLAYGWWILLTCLLLIIAWSLKKYLSYRRRCQAKKQAIKHIKENNLNSDQVLTTLKWAALQYFPRDQIASLTGDHLQQFLTSCLPIKQQEKFVDLISPILEQRYQCHEEKENNDALTQASLLWLTNALPPKKKVLEKQFSQQAINVKTAGDS